MNTNKLFPFWSFVLLFLSKRCIWTHLAHLHFTGFLFWFLSWYHQAPVCIKNCSLRRVRGLRRLHTLWNGALPKWCLASLRAADQHLGVWSVQAVAEAITAVTTTQHEHSSLEQEEQCGNSTTAWGPDYGWMKGTKDLLLKCGYKKKPCLALWLVFNLISINTFMMAARIWKWLQCGFICVMCKWIINLQVRLISCRTSGQQVCDLSQAVLQKETKLGAVGPPWDHRRS